LGKLYDLPFLGVVGFAEAPPVAFKGSGRQVGVSLRDCRVLVSKDLLKPEQIAAAHYPVAREGVSQSMEMDVARVETGADQGPLEELGKNAAALVKHLTGGIWEDNLR
jgi:hypothetical protein